MRLGQTSAWPMPQGPACGPAMSGPVTRAFIIFLLDNRADDMAFASTKFFLKKDVSFGIPRFRPS